ncbi:MAG TPA: hypothetical protein VFU78_14530 [Thermomicrobiales bacterium]|nr:hypothetical protein [Thermomicrobiales bacterium]
MLTGTTLLAFLAALAALAIGLAAGRWLRLRRRFDLRDVSRPLLSVTQGLALIATLGGVDQYPLSRAIVLAMPMACGLGALCAVVPGNAPVGRWWQLWRWRFLPSSRDRR